MEHAAVTVRAPKKAGIIAFMFALANNILQGHRLARAACYTNPLPNPNHAGSAWQNAVSTVIEARPETNNPS